MNTSADFIFLAAFRSPSDRFFRAIEKVSFVLKWIGLSVLLLQAVLPTWAAPVSEGQARRIAQQFFTHQAQLKNTPAKKESLTLALALPLEEQARCLYGSMGQTYTGAMAFYLYNRGAKGGFVMVAGDDTLPSILAYSLDSNFPTPLPAHIKNFIERMQEAVKNALQQPVEGFGQPIITQLASLPEQVLPLLGNIAWGQTGPFNHQTPKMGSQNQATPVGCVATAMVQVMRQFQWPEKGKGTYTYTERVHEGNPSGDRSHTVDFGNTEYKWQDMPAVVPFRPTQQQIDAYSTLSYQAGVSVDMMYAPNGSGSFLSYIPHALRTFFGYDNNVRLISRGSCTREEWETTIRTELQAGRSVIYGGGGDGGGHAFVCDGYDKSGLFHINWGWDGMGNGYFNLSILTPEVLGTGGGLGGGFNEEQEIVIGVQPDRTGSSQQSTPPQVTSHGFEVGCYDKKIYVYTATAGLLSERSIRTPLCIYLEPLTEGEKPICGNWTTDEYAINYGQYIMVHGMVMDFASNPFPPKNKRYRVKIAYRFNGQAVPLVSHSMHRLERIVAFDNQGVPSIEERPAEVRLDRNQHVRLSLRGYEKSTATIQLEYHCLRMEVLEGVVEFDNAEDNEEQYKTFGYMIPQYKWEGEGLTPPIQVVADRLAAPPGAKLHLRLRLKYYDADRDQEISTLLPLTHEPVEVEKADKVRAAIVVYPSPEIETVDGQYYVNPQKPLFPSAIAQNIGTESMTQIVYHFRCSYTDSHAISAQYLYTPSRYLGYDIEGGSRSKIIEQKGNQYERGALSNMFKKSTVAYQSLQMFHYKTKTNHPPYPVLENYLPTLRFTPPQVKEDQQIVLRSNRPLLSKIFLRHQATQSVRIKGGSQSLNKHYVTLFAPELLLTGAISKLNCAQSELTELSIKKGRTLHTLVCSGNQLAASAITKLIESLPFRSSSEKGKLVIIDSSSPNEGNELANEHILLANKKNWELYDGKDESATQLITGQPEVTHEVILQVQGPGELNMITTGIDLKAVPDGTAIKLKATPHPHCHLVALTANGETVPSNGEVTISAPTTIVATFGTDSYPVMLQSDEHGTISVASPSSLDLAHVPYGTRILIEAIPQDQYELDTLTANGVPIMEEMGTTIEGETTIVASFRLIKSITRLPESQSLPYPNPTEGIISIQLPIVLKEAQLYSSDGNLLETTEVKGDGKVSFDLTQRVPGIYFIHARDKIYKVIRK